MSFRIRVCSSPLIVDTLVTEVVDDRAERANPLELLVSARFRNVLFTRCKLDGSQLRMITGDHVTFDQCQMTGADLYAAQLVDVSFLACELDHADFSQASAPGMRLFGSTFHGVKGAAAFRGSYIDAGQVLPMAGIAFQALDITISEPGED